MFVVIAILTTICRKYANWILRNGPLTITVDFLKLKLCFKFPFYLIHSHILCIVHHVSSAHTYNIITGRAKLEWQYFYLYSLS